MRAEIDLSELSDLGEHFKSLAPKQAKAAVRKALVAEGRRVKSKAQSLAPKDRPWLAQSIHMKTWTNPDGAAVNVFSELFDPEGRPVAVFVEHGTTDTPPQPFMGPAGSGAEASLPRAVADAIDPLSTDTDGGPEA